MSVISTCPDIEPIDAAIQEHLADPRIPVMRLCTEHGVSRATFYRRLKKVSEPAAVKVSVPPSPEAVSDLPPREKKILRLAVKTADSFTVVPMRRPSR